MLARLDKGGWVVRMRNRYVVAGFAFMALTLAACAGGGSEEGADSSTPAEGEASMRFVFSPDPVWNWLEDEGILAEMEEEAGMTIERNESEDEFAFFAGGHADIVSTGSYETPVLESEKNARDRGHGNAQQHEAHHE